MATKLYHRELGNLNVRACAIGGNLGLYFGGAELLWPFSDIPVVHHSLSYFDEPSRELQTDSKPRASSPCTQYRLCDRDIATVSDTMVGKLSSHFSKTFGSTLVQYCRERLLRSLQAPPGTPPGKPPPRSPPPRSPPPRSPPSKSPTSKSSPPKSAPPTIEITPVPKANNSGDQAQKTGKVETNPVGNAARERHVTQAANKH